MVHRPVIDCVFIGLGVGLISLGLGVWQHLISPADLFQVGSAVGALLLALEHRF